MEKGEFYLAGIILSIWFGCATPHATNLVVNEDCPIISEYRFFEIHSSFDSCMNNIRNYYGKDIFQLPSYGYEVKEIYSFGWKFENSEHEIFKEVALDMEFVDDTYSKIDFTRFSKLEFLRLRGIKTIPESIFKLHNLKVLCIFSKELTNIPDEIVELSNLKVLDIVTGDKIEKATDRIGELKQLEFVRLCRLYSIKSLYIDFTNLSHLKRIELWDNPFQIVNNTIVNCNNLYYLHARNIDTYFKDLESVRILGIDEVENNQNLRALKNMSSLEELYISNYRLKIIKQSIAKIPNLKILFLSMQERDARIDRPFLKFDSLRHLSIYSDYVREFPKFDMPNLIYLNFVLSENMNDLTDASPLLKYINLKYLYMVIGNNYDGLNLKDRKDVKFRILEF